MAAASRLFAAPPSVLLPPPSDDFPCGLYKALCHSDLYSKDRQRCLLHYGITRQDYSPFSFQSELQLQVCPPWLPAPLCSVKGRQLEILSGARHLQYPHCFSHCYNSTNLLLCPIHGLNVFQIFHQGSCKEPVFTG